MSLFCHSCRSVASTLYSITHSLIFRMKPILSQRPAASEARAICAEHRNASHQKPPGFDGCHTEPGPLCGQCGTLHDCTCWARGRGTSAPHGSLFKSGQSSVIVSMFSCRYCHASWAISGKKSPLHHCIVSSGETMAMGNYQGSV